MNNRQRQLQRANQRQFNPGKPTKDFYIYQASIASLAFGVSQTDQINIETDAVFVVVKIAFFADLAGAVQTANSRVIPLINISITDSGSGRNLQSEPIPINSLAGSGQLPFVLPVPREFKANATISVTFANVSAASTYLNTSLSFIGYKVFSDD